MPEWITQLPKIERVDFSYNKIISIPELSGVQSLTEIDIQENELEYFPWKLLDKENLRILIVRGNPFILDANETKLLKTWENDLTSGKAVLVY